MVSILVLGKLLPSKCLWIKNNDWVCFIGKSLSLPEIWREINEFWTFNNKKEDYSNCDEMDSGKEWLRQRLWRQKVKYGYDGTLKAW